MSSDFKFVSALPLPASAYKPSFVEQDFAFSQSFIDFSNSSSSPFHAVSSAIKILRDSHFTGLSEKSDADWKTSLKPGGKYYFQRDQSTLIAIAIGPKYRPGSGFTIMAAHTDSPVLKVKPVSKVLSITSAAGMQLGVEPYGGGLWYSWFDRDLSLAGRMVVHDEAKRSFTSTLVHVPRSILRIPSLAIHLNRELDTAGFNPNKQLHLVPIYGSAVGPKEKVVGPKEKVGEEKVGEEKVGEKETTHVKSTVLDGHDAAILKCLADEAKVDPASIRALDLNLFDTQPACLGGLGGEFIFSRALDNLCMSYVILRALADSTVEEKSWEEEENIRIVALFDHEEVGSVSDHGAASSLLPSILRRIHDSVSFKSETEAKGETETKGETKVETKMEANFDAAMKNSILVSADMAHAWHPNYSDKHDSAHRPVINGGLVIKENANQRYATTPITAFFITEIARRYGLPVQHFVTRSDMPCGSTIGPVLSAGLSMRTVDVGIAQWSMHSIRETCGRADLWSSYQLLKHFFADFPTLDKLLI